MGRSGPPGARCDHSRRGCRAGSRRDTSARRSPWRPRRSCSSLKARPSVRGAGRCCPSSVARVSSRSGWPSSPAGPLPPTGVPGGDGPWRLVVETTGSPARRPTRKARPLATRAGCIASVQGSRPPCRPIRSWFRATGSPSTARSDPRPDFALWRVPASDRRGGHPHIAFAGDRASPRQPRSASRAAPPWRRARADSCPAGARSRPSCRDPHRSGVTWWIAILPRRSRPRVVSHVVAISGWNIAIVAAAIGAMTGRLGRRRRSVVTIVAIVLYVAFAGASASVMRGALMAAVVLLARRDRPRRTGHRRPGVGPPRSCSSRTRS